MEDLLQKALCRQTAFRYWAYVINEVQEFDGLVPTWEHKNDWWCEFPWALSKISDGPL
jgi:hypothetical protein